MSDLRSIDEVHPTVAVSRGSCLLRSWREPGLSHHDVEVSRVKKHASSEELFHLRAVLRRRSSAPINRRKRK
jgi:hypothetical protein